MVTSGPLGHQSPSRAPGSPLHHVPSPSHISRHIQHDHKRVGRCCYDQHKVSRCASRSRPKVYWRCGDELSSDIRHVIRISDEPVGYVSNEMLCKSPAPPFGSRIDFGNCRDILCATGDSTDGSNLPLGFVDPDETFGREFPCLNHRSVDLKREVHL